MAQATSQPLRMPQRKAGNGRGASFRALVSLLTLAAAIDVIKFHFPSILAPRAASKQQHNACVLFRLCLCVVMR